MVNGPAGQSVAHAARRRRRRRVRPSVRVLVPATTREFRPCVRARGCMYVYVCVRACICVCVCVRVCVQSPRRKLFMNRANPLGISFIPRKHFSRSILVTSSPTHPTSSRGCHEENACVEFQLIVSGSYCRCRVSE